MKNHRIAGFTLIELMVVVAVVAILAAITLPSFADQMRKSRRAAAVSALQDAQVRLERWRVDHADYSGSGVTIPDSSAYQYAVTAAAGTNDYKVEAKPLGNQTKDLCGTMSIAVTGGGVPVKSPTDAVCW